MLCLSFLSPFVWDSVSQCPRFHSHQLLICHFKDVSCEPKKSLSHDLENAAGKNLLGFRDFKREKVILKVFKYVSYLINKRVSVFRKQICAVNVVFFFPETNMVQSSNFHTASPLPLAYEYDYIRND